ncbi:hypothetical protein Lepto782_06810 [Leptospira interrogans serovar Canicola]|uniref:Uncharacterized protein n=1 Tax=Leptospira interrogans serovar Canicola TaxID=211880 RepID=A0AAP9WDC8_LEPIR|nr:hypothetical protein [Leptospira interrogans]QOI42004.1 hypothetical protein Lepto782_06810 [Leptospira interrogans serovar Canicola]
MYLTHGFQAQKGGPFCLILIFLSLSAIFPIEQEMKETKPSKDFVLIVSLSKQDFNVDEKIKAVIRFRNVSGQLQSYGFGDLGKDFNYILECYAYLKNKNGGPPQALLRTQHGEWMAQKSQNEEIMGALNSGKELVNTISVSRQCDLTMTGTYQFVVKRHRYPSLKKSEIIVSDPIVFRVHE